MNSQFSYFPVNNNNEIARNLLFHAFVKLLVSKPMTSISVVEICKTAGVARSTFYFNFHSKEDMFDKYLDSQLYVMTRRLRRAGKSPHINGYSYFVSYLQLHKFLIDLLIKNRMEETLSEHLSTIVKQLLQQDIFIKTINAKFQVSFITGGLIAVIITWAQQGYKENNQQLMNIILNLLQVFKK